ncbi:SRPBCC family protein [Nocardia otitidiscaviarum]|uniref:SRPBCC family protein n=1 Tax=Nocardia otitidiscaviarum TaxID=1823 RepID=UPI002455DB76|nr:SRPBCC family protein [Nocardia otitidiscaviarum]
MDDRAELNAVRGEPILRLERRLAHPPEKVWKAITDPKELAAWFPAMVDYTELRPGVPMRFTFPGEAVVDGTWAGEVLEVDRPKVFMFRWSRDVLRFELMPDGAGCRLVLTQTIGGGGIGRLGAARSAVGWEDCLTELAAALDGVAASPNGEFLPRVERYIAEFDLGTGVLAEAGDDRDIRFVRDLVWKPADEVWSVLVEDAAAAVGGQPPVRAYNEHIPIGTVTAVEPPRILEYSWLHDGVPVGRVRWTVVTDPEFGTRVELSQTLPRHLIALAPEFLAAWHVHLDLFFAAVHGEVRCGWPADRVAVLTERYASIAP